MLLLLFFLTILLLLMSFLNSIFTFKYKAFHELSLNCLSFRKS